MISKNTKKERGKVIWTKRSLSFIMTACLIFSGLTVAFKVNDNTAAAQNMSAESYSGAQSKGATKTEEKGLSKQVFALKEDFAQAKLFDESKKDYSEIKLNFGTYNDNPMMWYVAGADNNKATLYAAQNLGQASFAKQGDKTWGSLSSEVQNSIKYAKTPASDYKLNPNHYGVSTIREKLKDLSKTLFISGEQKFIKNSTIEITDFYKNTYTVTDKLFLPSAVLPSASGTNTSGTNNSFISVGDNKNSYKVDLNYIQSKISISGTEKVIPSWTLSPSPSKSQFEITASGKSPGKVSQGEVVNGYALIPALNLDIENISFASKAKAGIVGYNKVEENNPFALNLRYKDSVSPSYEINTEDGKEVVYVSGATGYNVIIQGFTNNINWVFGKPMDTDGKIKISTSEITGLGNSFKGCKIWVEKVKDGLIYASYAKNFQEKPSKPVVKSTTPTSITLEKVDDQEYACKTSTVSRYLSWRDVPEFTDLDENQTYDFVTRKKGSQCNVVSAISDKCSEKTKTSFIIKATADYGGKIDPKGDVNADAGVDKEFKITPSENMKILAVYVDDSEIDLNLLKHDKESDDYFYTFKNILSDHSIEVYFEKAPSTKSWEENEHGQWQYIDDDGNYLTGWYDNIAGYEGKKFYFDENGYMALGWRFIDGEWYYFNKSEDCTEGQIKTGWFKDFTDNKWYYFDDNSGKMIKGWFKDPDDGAWYFFNDISDDDEVLGEMETGWVLNSNDNSWYYLSEDPSNNEKDLGKMVTGTIEINGKQYTFDNNGLCLNP